MNIFVMIANRITKNIPTHVKMLGELALFNEHFVIDQLKFIKKL